MPHPRVAYRATPAETSGLKDGWADLVTVGQAVHWFELKSFYEEVRRVGAPGSALAVWAYDLLSVNGVVDTVFTAFHASVEKFWPVERALVARRYADLFFPFEEIPVALVTMTASWDLEHLLGYLSTWSCVKRCTKETGRDPIAEFAELFANAWGDLQDEKSVTWPLVLRAGRIA
jgi:hypothetical protein